MPLSRDQLAVAMNQSPSGGGFNTKISTARLFGVIETNAGKYQLTDLGFEIADPGRQREALITAFLNVELYRKIYEEFRGKRLPPRPHGLENALISMGVSQKQAGNARLYFDRSARKAGFFPNGDEDRLVVPFGGGVLGAIDRFGVEPKAEETTPAVAVAAPAPAPAPSLSGNSGLHPAIQGMLAELPLAKSSWGKQEQADWLDALAGMFQVLYKSEDKGEIKVSYAPATSKSPA